MTGEITAVVSSLTHLSSCSSENGRLQGDVNIRVC